MPEAGNQIVKAGAVSAPVLVAGAFLVAQVFAASIITDLMMSVLVFGAGYTTCWLTKKKS